jgi:hypothetical protein
MSDGAPTVQDQPVEHKHNGHFAASQLHMCLYDYWSLAVVHCGLLLPLLNSATVMLIKQAGTC